MRRIVVTAQRLVLDRGLEGFTMDDLAQATGVSRRTLFNYFPSKLDACLGPAPDLPEELMATFCAGGPTGNLASDLEVVARHVLGDKEPPTTEEIQLGRALLRIPRLQEAVHERFEDLARMLQEGMQDRESEPVDPASGRLLGRLLVAVVESTVDASVAGDDTPLPDLFSRQLAAARALLA